MSRRTSLVSRELDFWLLGGASLVVYLAMWVGSAHKGYYGVSNHFQELAATMALLSLVVNYPHFLASYRLAYLRGWAFIRRHWFQTLLVPMLLLNGLFACFYLVYDRETQELGRRCLGWGINLMYFTVGWHYAKQAFGCVMVYAAYTGFALSNSLRWQIRLGLLSIWWYNFAYHCLDSRGSYWQLDFLHWRIPNPLIEASFWVFALLQVALLASLMRQRRWPPATVAVPYFAMLAWFAPCFRQPDFYFYVVPFFHSLQYLAFVYRVEHSGGESQPSHWGWVVVLGLALSGWLAFEFVPGNLDLTFENRSSLGFSFFLIAFNLFINIHHYFLDNVLWRVRDDEKLRHALFH